MQRIFRAGRPEALVRAALRAVLCAFSGGKKLAFRADDPPRGLSAADVVWECFRSHVEQDR